MEWPLTGRDSILRRLGALLAHGSTGGIEIVGGAGVGKSRIARELAAQATERGRTVHWIAGSHATVTIPLGALARLLNVRSAQADERRLLAQLRTALGGGELDRQRPVLIVDDAHLLDDRSAALLHEAVAQKVAFTIFTLRLGAQVPAVLTELWKDGLVQRIELAPLTQAVTLRLVEAALAGPVEPLTAASIWQRSRGNPLYVRELVLGGLESGALVRESAAWRLVRDAAPSARLVELVGIRLGRLDPAEREAVEALALGGVLDLEMIESLVGAEALERLEERRIVAIRRTGNRHLIDLTHPVYGEVMADGLPRTRARRLMRGLADRLESTGVRRRDDLLRLARWRLEGGGESTPDSMVEAARHALAAFDAPLAERLARAALARRPNDAAAQLVLGRAMTSQEHVEAADAVLAAAATSARSDEEIAGIALAHANLLYFRAGRTVDAVATLEAAARRVVDADWRDEIDSLLVLFRAGAGDLPGVVATGWRLARRGDARPRAVVHALMYASIANVMLGRFADAEVQVEIGLRLVPRTREDLPLAGEMLKINRVMAAAYGGRHARSLELGRAGHRAAVDAGATELAAMWGMNLAECQMLAGDVDDARRTMLAALAVVRQGDPFSVRGIDAAVASIVCTWLGRHEEARELHQEIVVHRLARDVRSRIQFERAAVWVGWTQDGADAAARAALAAGDRAAADTHVVWAAWLFHDAVRLGRPDLVADRLAALARIIEGDLVPCMAAHAEALNAHDGAALDRVSAKFERLDSTLFAAEAAAQAHDAHLRHGEPQLARIGAARAAILASRCPGVRTPPLADATAVPLTARELEVARLAATGLSSRAIGERLHVSVRTVDNHLGAVYGKLGANRRADLAALFGPTALLAADGKLQGSTAPVSAD